MDDAVVDIARSRFAATGGGTVLFNFRGVGASEGVHSGGAGEVDDLLAVANWLEANHTVERLTLVGYSFGSSVAWRAREKLGADTPVILIAPPVGNMDYPANPVATGAVIAGDEDQFIDAEALARWLGEHGDMRLVTLDGAGHFLAANADDLAGALDEAMGHLVATLKRLETP